LNVLYQKEGCIATVFRKKDTSVFRMRLFPRACGCLFHRVGRAEQNLSSDSPAYLRKARILLLKNILFLDDYYFVNSVRGKTDDVVFCADNRPVNRIGFFKRRIYFDFRPV